MKHLLTLFNRQSPARLGRAGAKALSDLVSHWNRSYRDNLNPVRGLTMSRAVGLIESYARGEYADLMWTFGAPFNGIESADPDVSALIERRCSPLLEMDWNALIVGREGIDEALAAEQQAFVRDLMDGVGNLYAAIEHLALASFRGFAHCEQVFGRAGALVELRPVPQWQIVRDGSRGGWRYNPDARQTSWRGLSPELDIDPARWVIREVARPIHRISLVKFIREQLSQKDWDAFIEIYGIPGGVVIGPPNIPESKEAEYSASASTIATGGSGYLPNGSSYIANVLPRGNQPFADHLRYLSEKLVLAATGGKLTMLAESGSGTLAGGAHADTFEQIARAEARRISEIIDQQVVQPRLRAAFPEQESLAYWSLAFTAETDVGEIVEHALKLSQAGYAIDAEELAEKTGYRVQLSGPTAGEAQTATLPDNGMALQIAGNGLQIGRSAKHGPSYPSSGKTPHSGDFLRVANRAVIAAEMSDLLTRMESGDSAAIDEALELIERLGPETLAEVGALVTALERAAMEAAVLGAMGEEVGGADASSVRNTQARDERGRFASGGGRPALIPVAEADAILTTGFTEIAADGSEVTFGSRLKAKLDKARDGDARKAHLRWARDTVKSGKPVAVEVRGEQRTVFAKLYTEHSKKDAGLLVIVDTQHGQAFNFYRADPKKLRTEYGVSNTLEKGLGPEERPSAEILEALAAAGLLPPKLVDTTTTP